AWLTAGNYHVYLQRFDPAGEPQFEENGMLVSDNANSSWIAIYHLNIVVDSDNNAILTTVDERTGIWEVYAWKIAPDGTMLWGDDGLPLTNSGVVNISPRLTALPDNSVIVTWTQDWDTVRLQHLSPAGELLWGDGILIEDNNAALVAPLPIVTSDGNVLVQWIRQTGSPPYYDSELLLQKYNLDGDPQWGAPVLAVGPVVFPAGNWLQQSVSDLNGGSYSAWTELSGTAQGAWAQHITGDGYLPWASEVELSTNSSNFRVSPMIAVANETQELMAVWREANGSQSLHSIYAQRLDSNGNRLWGSNGATVVAPNSNYDYLDLSVAGFGEEMISVYVQQSVNMNGDIYANRLDAEGNLAWTEGIATVTTSGSPKADMMTGKGPGGLFIAWTQNGSIYAHCLREDGTLGPPDMSGELGDVLLVPTDYATIQEAIIASEDRDTILVAPGTYQENINYSGKNIVIGSYYLTYSVDYFIEQTIIDGNQNGTVVTFENREDSTAVLTGFTIMGGSADFGGGIRIDSARCTLRNLVITGNTANNYGGGILSWESNPSFENLTITSNMAGNSGGGGIYSYSSGISLENVNISDNATSGPGGGIYYNQSNSSLTHVTISGNSAAGENGFGGAIYHTTFSNTTLLNSIFWNNSPQEIYFDGNPEFVAGSTTAAFCDIQGGQESIVTNDNGTVTWEEGNINADPLFCAPDSGDFSLAASSPCVGTGQDGANMGAFGVGCNALFAAGEITPTKFTLYQNYPNPFNPTTTIRFDLVETWRATSLLIYDITGRVVETLVNEQIESGQHEIQWDASQQASGIYFVELVSGENRKIQKMILLK
ncbi:MAG TPA: T9SS type A sorting domain-containing protein, partial [Candidatus Marinimicrobia bacterium]|nr:T9SS type A sorting domain-containing protein [Candidatus Neomarinimicrobiota bacterium]